MANTVIGYRQRSVIVNVLNDGDVESGIRAEITAVSTVVNPKILNVTTGEFLRFILTLSAEDTLTVSTGYGEKGATYTHEGTTEDAQVSLSKGGTGQTSAAAARNALGLGNTTGALPVANGGTGASSAKAALQNLGIFYADTLPADGTDGQICLVPVG